MHQVWFQGRDRVPAKYHASMRRLRTLNPGWQHHVWADADLRQACALVGPDVLEAYDRATLMHQKIDLGRMCVLYVHGGITVDMDIQPLRPLSAIPGLRDVTRLTVSLLPLNSFESYMAYNLRCLRFDGGQTCSAVNNACIIAPPHDPALLHVIRHCANQIVAVDPRGVNATALMNMTTGPVQFGRVLADLPPGLKVDMLPARYLEPCIGHDAYCVPGREAVVHHQHDNTWLPQHTGMLYKLYFHAKHNWELLAAAQAAVLLAVLMWLTRRRA